MSQPNPLLFLIVAKLRAAREKQGMSQEDLASRCGFTEKQVAKWERGFRQPSAFLLAIWAYALGFVVVPVEASTVQNELRASMEEVSRAKQNATATMNSLSCKKRARLAALSCSRSTTSPSTASPSEQASRSPVIPGIFDTLTETAA